MLQRQAYWACLTTGATDADTHGIGRTSRPVRGVAALVMSLGIFHSRQKKSGTPTVYRKELLSGLEPFLVLQQLRDHVASKSVRLLSARQ